MCLCVRAGLVIKSDPESETESEASEGSHDPGSRSESPELDDVKGTDTRAVSQITKHHAMVTMTTDCFFYTLLAET